MTHETRRKEHKLYYLLRILNVHMLLIYGEGSASAFCWLQEEIDKCATYTQNVTKLILATYLAG